MKLCQQPQKHQQLHLFLYVTSVIWAPLQNAYDLFSMYVNLPTVQRTSTLHLVGVLMVVLLLKGLKNVVCAFRSWGYKAKWPNSDPLWRRERQTDRSWSMILPSQTEQPIRRRELQQSGRVLFRRQMRVSKVCCTNFYLTKYFIFIINYTVN